MADSNFSERLKAATESAAQTGQAIETAAQAVAAENSRRVGRDRSYIATIIIATYAIAVLGIIAYIAFAVPVCTPVTTGTSDPCKALLATWEKQADLLMNLTVTAVVPIVTLMLGFYFGTETSRESQGQS